jgi:hypothetical protein
MELAEVRVLFYRPKWFDGHSIDNIISEYTYHANLWLNPAKLDMNIFQRSKLLKQLACSHVEKGYPGEDGNFASGQMFTSTMRQNAANGNTDGIVMRPTANVLTHPERWFYARIIVPETAMEYSLEWCKEMVRNNQGYDKEDIKKFFQINAKKRIQDVNDGKFICSGAVWAALYMERVWRIGLIHDYEITKNSSGRWDKNLKRLFHNRDITNIMSPLLLTIWIYQAGYHFYEVKNDSMFL